MDTKFGTNVSNRMLLNAAKFQGYSFYRFWVIKGKPTRGVKLPPTQIRVNVNTEIQSFARQLYLLFVSAVQGKIAGLLKRGRYKSSVALYPLVASYNLYRYTTDKSFQLTYAKAIWAEYTTFLDYDMLVPI